MQYFDAYSPWVICLKKKQLGFTYMCSKQKWKNKSLQASSSSQSLLTGLQKSQPLNICFICEFTKKCSLLPVSDLPLPISCFTHLNIGNSCFVNCVTADSVSSECCLAGRTEVELSKEAHVSEEAHRQFKRKCTCMCFLCIFLKALLFRVH